MICRLTPRVCCSLSSLRTTSNRLISQPVVQVLLLLLAFVSLYTLYGFYFFYRDPLSIFFSEEHGFDRFYSAVRQAEADHFIDSMYTESRVNGLRLGKAGDDPEMCAVFITVGRSIEGRQYIDSAVGSFLANMSRLEREAIHLKLFFADVPDPNSQHASYDNLVAADIADDIITYPATLPSTTKDHKIKTLVTWASDRQNKHALERKTIHDYAYALAQCAHTTDAPYIAVFEGDILLADGWAARTLKNLRIVEKMMAEPTRRDPVRGRVEPGRPNSWLYLRLFNQERSTGWAGGTGFRDNHVHIISMAVCLPLLLVLTLLRKFILTRRWGQYLDRWVLLLVCGVAVPLFVWLFYASGKASILGAPRGVREEFFGCCNQALIYNKAHALALSDFLMAMTVRQKPGRSDMLPKDFAWSHGLARISAYPMMAQHAGRISAIDTSNDEAKRVWSMAFESLKPSKLAQDHMQDVTEVFGNS
ncbi:hypothetical protein F4775DRAFT_534311 [Biscogniauxia sp. FL1348]|nr:hypothetical protein F4775DRAFT_534311 [Biscogniauxia sp. FL1348]